MIEIEQVKEYLRIDGTYDDSLLVLLMESAKEYLENAGVPECDSKAYELAILMLVTHWYENREQQVVGKTSTAIDHGLRSIILQLRVGASGES
ncbi:head-tail connector protein [Bacillus cihuensis]|uniref:head-tail connector protein n=1 Tax=Bacillus cihuensis TaxID=1208599 RepID=UPI000416842E|nr:head-tail connector protein [Bacillus cihuensis]